MKENISTNTRELQELYSYGMNEKIWKTLVKWSHSLTIEEYTKKYHESPELSFEEFQKMGGSEQQYQHLLYKNFVSKVCFCSTFE